MIDLMLFDDFLDAGACEALRAELAEAGGSQATLLGRQGADAVQPQVRRATRAAIPPATRERVTRLLMERREAIGRHFGLALGACEEPQFLRYQVGDFFVAHQDGNTPLVFDESRFRKISAVIFLSRPSQQPAPGTYGGGTFVFHGPFTDPELRLPLSPPPGTLVAFRAETTHEVTAVTHGERLTVVSWFR
ncbi:MAG TPA: 2OG-Fe(II) oxygenase [Xanthobacteraceae bacterium]|jgi:predicted 2-oxoglutarate/Fe(II)-dependent dioxygenase YbiX